MIPKNPLPYEILTSMRSRLAEGPLYHSGHDSVYWTDIEGGHLHRYRIAENRPETVHTGTKIGGFTVQENGDLLLFRQSGAIHVWSERGVSVLLESLQDELTTRFNDVSADPTGRVFCGTMPTADRKGRLYRLDHDGTIQPVLEEVGCSNGMGWSPDEKTMYFTDTGEGTIYAFDYEARTSEITNRREFYVHREGGAPDGLTLDAEGNVWTALWGGGRLVKLSPSGEILTEIQLPAQNITCPAFGGKDLDELYVTAAGGETPEHGLGAGELMRLRVGVKGKPEYRSRIRIPATE